MSSSTYTHLVFIGRFQPFHVGHKAVIERAFTYADTVILLIGSANSPRTPKNPFNFHERAAMIQAAFPSLPKHKTLSCLPLNDATYNDARWLQNVQSAVASVSDDDSRIAIVGHDKDDSSYYLKLFPQWGFVAVENFSGLSATPLRDAYLATGEIDSTHLPSATIDFLSQFKNTPDYAELKQQVQTLKAHKQAWQVAPYPPTFITADAVVVQAGHILLIERGGDYGRGLWALPGGFVDGDEHFVQCALRELKEEAGLDLKGQAPIASMLFDAPKRSLRGRTVTLALHFALEGDTLPTLRHGDDAARAFWLPLSQLDAARFFEDHYGIICQMLRL